MRWFSDAAYDVGTDDAAWDQILRDYYEHVRVIAPSLSPDLARLALDDGLNLHDARFHHVEIDLDRRVVSIAVSAGDNYRRITMVFDDATVVPDNLMQLGYAVAAEFRPMHRRQRRAVTVILAQEVDLLPDGRHTLRLRLWPFYEFAVEFAGFTLTEEAIEGRGRTRGGTFEILGTGAG